MSVEISGTNIVALFPNPPWSSAEIARLRATADLGAVAVAALLGRSVYSVKKQAQRQGISLRTQGQRRGRILGMPNGTAGVYAAANRLERLARIRAMVISGTIELADVTAYMDWMIRGEPLCPRCARFPALVETTGLCRPCHLRLYEEGVEYALEVKAAQRANDAARQRKHKAKVRAAVTGGASSAP